MDSLTWHVMDATADDWESLDQILPHVHEHHGPGEPAAVAEVLAGLVRQGLMQEMKHKVIDPAAVVASPTEYWFQMTLRGRLAWDSEGHRFGREDGLKATWSQDRLDGGLIHAADYGDVEDAIGLMRAGANPSGYPLIMAIQAGHPRVVEAMLSFGADPNQVYVPENYTDRLAVTPLNHAIHSRELEIVRLLLDAGADPNASDGRGMTPLSVLDAPSPLAAPADDEIRNLLKARGAS